MKTVSIIKNRGQLTIPNSIRKTVGWVSPMSKVSITVIKPDEIVIKPHQTQADWDEIWTGINRARSIKGKSNQGNLAGFINKDRPNH